MIVALVLISAVRLAAEPARPAAPQQVSFEQAILDLQHADAGVRLRAARMLRDAPYEEAAVPLARLLTDPRDDVQLEAIGAELNIFLAEPVVARRRVGLVIEQRNAVAADAIFDRGPLALGPRTVPTEVFDALWVATRDDNPRVRVEAVYALGVLGVEPGGSRRRALLRASGPVLAAMIGAADPAHRYAALRVIGRLFDRRRQDDAIDQLLGDAVISVLNDREKALQLAAMQTLGALRYERAVQGLMDLFQYFEQGEMAVAALDALAHVGHPASVPLLAAQLASRDALFRGIAFEGLARAGDRTKASDIGAALATERDERVQLAGSFASALLLATGFDPIVEALGRPRLRDQARSYLIESAPGRAPLVGRHLQDPDPEVRAAIVDALALSADGAALPIVEPMAADPDPQVARAAQRAVARLRQLK